MGESWGTDREVRWEKSRAVNVRSLLSVSSCVQDGGGEAMHQLLFISVSDGRMSPSEGREKRCVHGDQEELMTQREPEPHTEPEPRLFLDTLAHRCSGLCWRPLDGSSHLNLNQLPTPTHLLFHSFLLVKHLMSYRTFEVNRIKLLVWTTHILIYC